MALRSYNVFAAVLIILLCVSCTEQSRESDHKLTHNDVHTVPNVILITIDTLRADHLSAYGYNISLPALERFANESSVFENHMTTSSFTLAAHTSMFSGLNVQSHSVERNGLHVPDSILMLPEIMQAQGIATGGFISAWVLNNETNFAQGFDTYDDPFSIETKRERIGGETIDNARKWLYRNKDSPFFLFIHMYDPHAPYLAPAGFRSKTNSTITRYDDEIRYVDSLLAKMFEMIDKEGLRENTLVIVTADHGESLGEHDFWGHGYCLSDPCIHIPLMIRYPGKEPARVSMQTSTIDIFPTILAFYGQEAPTEGIDLFSEDIDQREFVFGRIGDEQNASDHEEHEKKSALEKSTSRYGDHMVRTLNWKYLYNPKAGDRFYDIKFDPDELTDASKNNSERMNRGRNALNKLLENKQNHNTSLTISRENEEILRSLGYI